MSQCVLHNTTGCGISEMTIGLARRVTAFEDLLAVAKYADKFVLASAAFSIAPDYEKPTALEDLSARKDRYIAAIEALDKAHPGWREWTA